MEKILIIDDDRSQLHFFSKILESEFKIETSNNALDATKIYKDTFFDAVIVNIHKPILNGFEFINSIKANNYESKSALFILHNETSDEIKMRALRLGVNDFLCLRMYKEEIILRIRNQLLQKKLPASYLIKSYKNLDMNLLNLVVTQSEKKLDLTLLEFKLLSYLMTHKQTAVSRNNLKEFAWPNAVVQDKTLNTHISNLRSKLDTELLEIKSIKGEGFILI